MTTQEVLQYFRKVKRTGNNQYSALCPAHDDHTASLCIGTGDDGRTLVTCQRGCSLDDILSAVGLKKSDLFSTPLGPKQNKPWKYICSYYYPDRNGRPRNRKDRYLMPDGKKTFVWKHYDGKQWVKHKTKGDPGLYNADCIPNNDLIYIVEGEKDVETLKACGRAAVCSPHGAKQNGESWKTEYTEALKGKSVVVIQDNDETGKVFSSIICNALAGQAASVKLVDLSRLWQDIPEHGDITDYCQTQNDHNPIIKSVETMVAGLPEYQKNSSVTSVTCHTGEVSEENESLIQYKGKRLTLNLMKSALEILGITVKYNQLLKETDITGLPEWLSQENATNTLPVYLMDCFRECNVKFASRQVIEDYLFCIADQNRYNPLEEYFYHGKWDGKDRLQEVHRILSVTEPKYHRYIRKWLIQCVALALNDSETPVGSEGVLVLQGSQGLAKTSFFRILTPFPRWFVEGAVIDLKNKDSIINALSGWITELGELDATLQREQSSLKAFITNTEDRVRPPYGRTATRAPRRTSFCGTVNQDDYLRDTTGSRRFWTIPVTNIDTATLFSLSRDWVNQLWYQVYDIYQQDHNGFRLTKAEMKALQDDNLEFSLSLQYETEIREMLDYDLSPDQWEWWKASDVAQRLPGNAEVRKVGKALKKIVGSGKLEVYCNAPFPLKYTRIKDGIMLYNIPLKHQVL